AFQYALDARKPIDGDLAREPWERSQKGWYVGSYPEILCRQLGWPPNAGARRGVGQYPNGLLNIGLTPPSTGTRSFTLSRASSAGRRPRATGREKPHRPPLNTPLTPTAATGSGFGTWRCRESIARMCRICCDSSARIPKRAVPGERSKKTPAS